MASKQAPFNPREIDALLAQGKSGEALALSRAAVRRQATDLNALSALARSAFAFGLYGEARQAAARLLKSAPADQPIQLILALSEHNTGLTQDAIARLRRLVDSKSVLSADAARALAYVLEQAGRTHELDEHLQAGGPWLHDERAVLFEARRVGRESAQAGLDLLLKVAKSGRTPAIRRTAGFAAVQRLDAEGRYQEAFNLATAVHKDTTGPFDLGPIRAELTQQRAYFQRLAAQPPRAVQPVASKSLGTAFMLAMPRSGTTLVEQMLDRHSQVSGIGEYEGVVRVRQTLTGMGFNLQNLGNLLPSDAARIRTEYVTEAVARARPGISWTLDKSLYPWRYLPWLAAVLPDARYFHMERDPRDRAISMYLSAFHATQWAFTSSLDAIRLYTAMERELVPEAIQALGLRALPLQYEQLVEDPEGHARRMLAHLGLEFEPAVLAPEQNARAVLTLSSQQVRRSINQASIGRWKNYAFAFGPEWDQLASR